MLIDKVGYRDSTSQIFKKYNILKFKDLIDFHSCVLMFKASNNMLRAYVQTQFCRNNEIHKFETRNQDKLHVKSVNSNLKYVSVNHKGVILWNNLKSEIRNSASVIIFKKRPKFKFIQQF